MICPISKQGRAASRSLFIFYPTQVQLGAIRSTQSSVCPARLIMSIIFHNLPTILPSYHYPYDLTWLIQSSTTQYITSSGHLIWCTPRSILLTTSIPLFSLAFHPLRLLPYPIVITIAKVDYERPAGILKHHYWPSNLWYGRGGSIRPCSALGLVIPHPLHISNHRRFVMCWQNDLGTSRTVATYLEFIISRKKGKQE